MFHFSLPNKAKWIVFLKDKNESQNAAVHNITKQTDEEHAEPT